MENNIKSPNPVNIIKNILIFTLAMIPLVFGLNYGINDNDTLFNRISIIVLALAGSCILGGFIGEAKKDHGSGILVGLGFLLAILSMGIYFLGCILIFLG